MKKKVNVFGVPVEVEKIPEEDIPKEVPRRLHEFVIGEPELGDLGSYLRRVKGRLAMDWEDTDWENRDPIIYCSDISYCQAKAYLRRKYPNWLNQFPDEKFESYLHLKRGSWIDAVITSLFPKSQKSVTIPIPETNITLSGRIDFIDESHKLYELKWVNDFASNKIDKEGPYPYHITQPILYSYARKYDEARLLYYHSTGIDIWSLNLGNREKVIDKIMERAKKFHKSIVEDRPTPEPNYAFDKECDFCEFGEKIAGDLALCNGRQVKSAPPEIGIGEDE